jgi:hypothetical protein
MKKQILIIASLALAACSQSPSSVRITQDVPTPVQPVRKLVVSKSEPVFYNGKTYRVDLSPAGEGSYVVAVAGMGAAQEKDAMGLSRSAFHHFTCKDSQSTKFLTKPIYNDKQWSLTAKCG